MRITGLKTFVVDAFRANYVFVKVLTDEGLHGLGEGTVEHRPIIGLNSIHEASSCKGLVPGRPCPLLLSDLRATRRVPLTGYAGIRPDIGNCGTLLCDGVLARLARLLRAAGCSGGCVVLLRSVPCPK